jgi:hypothetical protein
LGGLRSDVGIEGAGVNRHGGARDGAGRPRKWHFEDVLRVGQSCETKWRVASQGALDTRYAALPHQEDIQALHNGVNTIPAAQRQFFLANDSYEDHRDDLESLLHARAGTAFDDETLTFDDEAPRGVTISGKPPKGTRRRIIGEVANETGLSESAVDNLWQEYRRFERDTSTDAFPS